MSKTNIKLLVNKVGFAAENLYDLRRFTYSVLSFHRSDVGKCGVWPGSGEVQRVGEEESYHPKGTELGRHVPDLQNCQDNMGLGIEGLWPVGENFIESEG